MDGSAVTMNTYTSESYSVKNLKKFERTYSAIYNAIRRGFSFRFRSGRLIAEGPENQFDKNLWAKVKKNKGAIKTIFGQGRASYTSYLPSYSQVGLMALCSDNSRTSLLNIQVSYNINRRIDVTRLAQVIQELVQREESLRSSFIFKGAAPVATVISPNQSCGALIKIEKLCGSDSCPGEIADREFSTPFDLKIAPLFRCVLVEQKSESWLILTASHLIADGISLSLVIGAIFDAYKSGHKNSTSSFCKTPYGCYAAYQLELKRYGVYRRNNNYWKRQLEAFSEGGLPFRSPFEAGSVREEGYVTQGIKIDNVAYTTIKKLRSDNRLTTFCIVLALIKAVIRRGCDSDDVPIETAISGRKEAMFAETVGMFSDRLLILNKIKQTDSFNEILKNTTKAVHDAVDHHPCDLNSLLSIGVTSKIARESIRSGILVLEQPDAPTLEHAGEVWRMSAMRQNWFGARLIVTYKDTGSCLDFTLYGANGVYTDEGLMRLVNMMALVASRLLENPSWELRSIGMASDGELKQLARIAMGTKIARPKGTIFDLLEKQVSLRPDDVAIQSDGEIATYKEIFDLSLRIQRWTTLYRMERGDRIVLALPSSVAFVSAALGIMRAGCIYVPLDPGTPAERKRFVLNDLDAKAVICTAEDADALDSENIKPRIITVSTMLAEESMVARTSPSRNVSREDVAYIIYTSGSTGIPKGVIIKHDSLVNLVHSHIEMFGGMGQNLKVLQFASVAFDASISEIFTTLCAGGRLVIFDRSKPFNPDELYIYIEKHKISTITLPVSVIARLDPTRFNPNITLISAGELCPARIAETWGRRVRFVNAYGPTECTVCATYWVYDGEAHDDIAPIGRPIAGVKINILNSNGDVLPIGMDGEIVISGIAVGAGYWRRERESSRFETKSEGDRSYRTGDIGRWLPNGLLQCRGRDDAQVKINGVRIELGEIEAAAATTGCISAAKAIVGGGEMDKHITLFVQTDASSTWNVDDFYRALRAKLPELLVPQRVVPITRFPLTTNGKIDTESLKQRLLEISPRGADKMKSTKANHVADVFRRWLPIKQISTDTHFFRAGGTSLLAIHVIEELKSRYGYQILFSDFYESPTVAGVAGRISKQVAGLKNSVEDDEAGDLPVTFAQERMYALYQSGFGASYNMLGKIAFKGKVDASRLKLAFEQVISTHRTLRGAFKLSTRGELVLRPSNEICVECYNEHSVRPKNWSEINITKGPLLKVSIIRQDTGCEVHIATHHIVVDLMAIKLLLGRVVSIYRGNTCRCNSGDVRSFVAWERKFVTRKAISSYMATVGKVPTKNYLGLKVGNRGVSASVETTSIRVGPADIEKYRCLSRELSVPLQVVYLSAFALSLMMGDEAEHILLAVAVDTRLNSPYRDIITMAVSPCVLQLKIDRNSCFAAIVEETYKSLTRAMRHPEISCRALTEVSGLPLERMVTGMFVYNEESRLVGEFDGITYEVSALGVQQPRFPMAMVVSAVDGAHDITIERHNEVEKSEIWPLESGFLKILNSVVMHSKRKITEIVHGIGSDIYGVSISRGRGVAKRKDGIIEQFKRVVSKCGNRIAVACGSKKMTYDALLNRSIEYSRIVTVAAADAHYIGIQIPPSEDAIAAILGILMAGKAYVPFDPDAPAVRISDIATQCGIGIVLIGNGLYRSLDKSSIKIGRNGRNLNLGVRTGARRRPVYLIPTSGTAGRSKIVEVSELALVTSMSARMDYYGITFGVERIFLLASSLTFDCSVACIFSALLSGARLIIPHLPWRDGESLAAEIEQHRVTDILCVPLVYEAILAHASVNKLTTLRRVIVGGDICTPKLVCTHFARLRNTKLFNEYGPSEGCVWCSVHECSAVESYRRVPIGFAAPGYDLYIVDKYNRICIVGIKGEICIGGNGLANGYCGDPALTEEKFTSNIVDGRTIYKTGDCGVMDMDGNVNFLGRLDHDQIKVNGVRIEVEEINCILREVNGVIRAFTGAIDFGNGKILVSAIAIESHFDAERARQLATAAVLERLPRYMRPAGIIVVPSFPTNSSGKIDVQAATKIIESRWRPKISSTAVKTKTERALASAWEAVLGTDAIFRESEFFELGGHSLKAVALVSLLRQKYDLSLSVEDVFRHPQLAAQAAVVKKVLVKPRKFKNSVQSCPLSYAQERMLKTISPGDSSCNAGCCCIIARNVSVDQVKMAIGRVIAMHPMLRSEVRNDEQPRWAVLSETDVVDRVISIRPRTNLGKALRECRKIVVIPFQNNMEIYCRWRIYPLHNGRVLVWCGIHHIIGDGRSIEVLQRDFAANILNDHSNEQPQERPEFMEYIMRERGEKSTCAFNRETNLWVQRLKGWRRVEQLENYGNPTRCIEPESVVVELSVDDGLAVKAAASRHGVTLAQVSLAAYTYAIGATLKIDNFLMGLAFLRRTDADMDAIGYFADTQLLRCKASRSFGIWEIAKGIKEEMEWAKAMEMAPFPLIMSRLQRKAVAEYDNIYDFRAGFIPFERARSTDELTWIRLEGGGGGSTRAVTLYVTETTTLKSTIMFAGNAINAEARIGIPSSYKDILKRIAMMA